MELQRRVKLEQMKLLQMKQAHLLRQNQVPMEEQSVQRTPSQPSQSVQRTPLPSQLPSKPKVEGTTSLSDILEKTLYEEYKEIDRPTGTDVRESDHSNQQLKTSKKNSINQKMREMTTERVVIPKNDMIDSEPISNDSHIRDTPQIKGKKKSVVDLAKELENSRK